jgi:lactate dehydrogenase-like 2-hydroxyacid dehydrogenase
MAIARRALGFGMSVNYHSRSPRQDLDFHYCPSPLAPALESDFLILATPGGAGTRHMVNDQVLEALGPEGFLVNIARGSVIDTAALIAALQQRRIAGAALDVFDDEPRVDEALKTLDNVLLSPHVGGFSPEASEDSVRLVGKNLAAYFAGEPVLTPIHS